MESKRVHSLVENEKSLSLIKENTHYDKDNDVGVKESKRVTNGTANVGIYSIGQMLQSIALIRRCLHMAEAMRFVSGNATCIIMDDFCSYPDQAKRDAEIKKRVAANALRGIRANPEKYYQRLAEMQKADK